MWLRMNRFDTYFFNIESLLQIQVFCCGAEVFSWQVRPLCIPILIFIYYLKLNDIVFLSCICKVTQFLSLKLTWLFSDNKEWRTYFSKPFRAGLLPKLLPVFTLNMYHSCNLGVDLLDASIFGQHSKDPNKIWSKWKKGLWISGQIDVQWKICGTYGLHHSSHFLNFVDIW